MIKKEISLLGRFGVGKTSLVRKFAHSIFDDNYHSTTGVKIDKKVVRVGDQVEAEFAAADIRCLPTSAMDGHNVEEAFSSLAEQLLDSDDD